MPRTHKNYDEEFKRRAVELHLKSNNSLDQVARELGSPMGASGSGERISSEILQAGREVPTPLSNPEEMAREIRRLNRENAYLRRQRDILKKAASILAEDPQLGMR